MPRRKNIVDLRANVLRGAWRGAVAAMDEMTDDEVRLISRSDDVAGTAARWLLEYRRGDTERRQRVQAALHEWRRNGRSR